MTAVSSKDGEFEASTTTAAPLSASARPSPVTASPPERRDAATTSWPSRVSIVTSLDPMSPLPPTTTIFIRHLHNRSGSGERSGSAVLLDELERLFGDLAPAGVDRQRGPAAHHLDNLGHALVALLLFVRRVGDRPGDRMIRVGRDDQHRAPLRVRRVDLRLCPRVDVRGRRLEERLA